MRAGQLRQLMTLQSNTSTEDDVDSNGQPLQIWTDVRQLWASIRTLKGNEAVNAQQLRAEYDHEIKTRYAYGPITTDQRLVINSEIYNIVSVVDTDRRHSELVIGARRVTAS